MKNKNPAIEAKEKIIIQNFNKKNENEISKNSQELNEFENKWNMNNKIIELFAKNIEKDQELKEKYAIILIIILSVLLIALIVIFILKGCNVLEYSDTTFNIFITAGIAEVFVLVKVIVEYLFKDNLTEALKIILTNNNQLKYHKHNKKNKNSDKP